MSDDELAQQIGDNVRRERQARGLTQKGLAELTGIRVPHLSRLETASGPLPTVATLKKVADALGVPICGLIDPPAPKPRKGK